MAPEEAQVVSRGNCDYAVERLVFKLSTSSGTWLDESHAKPVPRVDSIGYVMMYESEISLCRPKLDQFIVPPSQELASQWSIIRDCRWNRRKIEQLASKAVAHIRCQAIAAESGIALAILGVRQSVGQLRRPQMFRESTFASTLTASHMLLSRISNLLEQY